MLEVDPGDVVTFETNDCFSGQIKSASDLVTNIDMSRLNSATGPVAVRGAKPGDSLVAEIIDVRPVRWGVATLIPGFGQLTHLVDAPVTQMFEVRDGLVRMNERISFPAKPMVGVVGVATAGEALATGHAGQHGVVGRGRVGHPAVVELGHRPARLLALEDLEAHVDLACDLDAGEADLAITHRSVHVTDREYPAGLPDWEEDSRALTVPVVVEVRA